MESTRDKLEELNLTRDEVERIGEALKNKEFRDLLANYVEEIQDPENKKIYEQEITQLEKERGVDVTFIHPGPGYVIKTSVESVKKAFINICVNEHIQKPSSSPGVEGGSRGLRWSLPHSLSPPREDIDNKGARCKVFDVVFHPDTLHLAQKNKAFANMVNKTACEAIETNFDVKLDQNNLKFPKLKYKGMPHASVVRKPSGEEPVERTGEEKEFYDKMYKTADEMSNKSHIRKSKKTRQNTECYEKSNYTTPKYQVKHRHHVDLQDFTLDKSAKLGAAIPKELVIEINLPLLNSASNFEILDVTAKTLHLISETPAKYKLNLTLPYSVNKDDGTAKFDKRTKILTVTLPVKRKCGAVPDCSDSGVESDLCPLLTPDSDFSESSPVTELTSPLDFSKIGTSAHTKICETNEKNSERVVQNSPAFRTKFLADDLHYSLPEYTSHVFDNIIAFTLNVKNVDERSVCKSVDECRSSVHLKFASMSSSFHTTYYAFYVQLPDFSIMEDEVSVETWDNNIVVQMKSQKPLDNLKCYYVGTDDADMTLKYVEELPVMNKIYQKSSLDDIIKQESTEADARISHHLINKDMAPIEEVEEVQKETKGADSIVFEEKTRAIDIASFSCESSSDELSHSYSPSKGKGILKRFSRKNFGRSISESSLDDLVCSSFENCHVSDSVIPEDGEISSSLKKTVRFNDVVSRQLYRSNSSILGQKKKNQRRAKNKKKALIRRTSESDASECDDMRGEEAVLYQVFSDEKQETVQDDSDVSKSHNIDNDIFQIDIDA